MTTFCLVSFLELMVQVVCFDKKPLSACSVWCGGCLLLFFFFFILILIMGSHRAIKSNVYKECFFIHRTENATLT